MFQVKMMMIKGNHFMGLPLCLVALPPLCVRHSVDAKYSVRGVNWCVLTAQSVWSSNNWVSWPDLRMAKGFSDEAWKENELWGTWRDHMHMLFINGSFSIHHPTSTPTRISDEIHYYKFITTIFSWHWWMAGIKLNYGNLLIEIRWLLNFRLLSEVRQWSFVS